MGLIRSLSLGIGVDNKPLKRGLNRSTKDIKQWSIGIPQIAIGGAIGNLASGAISTAIGGISSGIGSAFEFAIRDEQLETAFSTLLGGADKAKAVLSDLRDFGASTPFEFPGIADSAKKLISFGFAQEQLLPTLNNLGDVAAGLNIPFSDLSEIYGKARVQGTIFSEDINQLAGRGIPIFDELAGVMGVTAGEVKGLASKGKIGFGELEKAFQNMTGEGGRFSGMMAAQSQTAGGLISTLRDNVNLKLGQIGAGLFKVFDVKGLIGNAIGIIQGVGPTLDWLIDQTMQLQPVFKQTFNVVGSAIMTAWDIGSSVFGAIASLLSGFAGTTFKGFVISLVKGLATVEFGFKNWRKVGDLVIKTVSFKLVQFGNVVTHLFTQEIPYAIGWFGRNAEGIFLTVASNTLTLFENLGSNIVSVFTNLPGLISGQTDFADIFTPLEKGFLNVVEESFDLPQRVEGDIERVLREDLERLQTELSDGLSTHIETRLGELIPDDAIAPPPIEQPVIPANDTNADGQGAGVGVGNAVATEFAGLAEAGSQEFRDAILRFQGISRDTDVATEQRDLQKQQLDESRKTNELLGQQPTAPVFSIPGA